MGDKNAEIKSLENQLQLARKEINNLRQQLKTLNHVHRKECDEINQKLNDFQCLKCRNNQENVDLATTTVNGIDLPLRYIGVLNTQFPEKRGTPRQPGICSEMTGKITLNNNVFTNPEHALEGLEEFSHMWILFHFHKNDSTHIPAKVAPPRLNGLRLGVFSTRSPHRPCPIGLSLVKIVEIVDNRIYFKGVDMVDGTPVLDIKPYIPKYDSPNMANLYYPEESVFELDSTNMLRTSSPIDGGDIVDSGSNQSAPTLAAQGDTSNIRIMDGEENRNNTVLGASNIGNTSAENLEESFYNRSSARIGEREAPDGEEEEPTTQPPQSGSNVNLALAASSQNSEVRTPAWIDQPIVSTLNVTFKTKAIAQLLALGPEGEEKKLTITNILREDPRSLYLRERWGSHCYVFKIADLHVSCKFNDTARSVTVYQVFQNAVTESEAED